MDAVGAAKRTLTNHSNATGPSVASCVGRQIDGVIFFGDIYICYIIFRSELSGLRMQYCPVTQNINSRTASDVGQLTMAGKN
jgi:hypothetical protein